MQLTAGSLRITFCFSGVHMLPWWFQSAMENIGKSQQGFYSVENAASSESTQVSSVFCDHVIILQILNLV